MSNSEGDAIAPTTSTSGGTTNYGAIVVQNTANVQNTTDSTNANGHIPIDDMSQYKSSLNFFEKVGYGLGHVYNDLSAGVWFSYTLLFLQGALGMSSPIAGTLVMVGQVGDAIATPIAGYVADRYWTKRNWHIIGKFCNLFFILFNVFKSTYRDNLFKSFLHTICVIFFSLIAFSP